MEKQDLPLVMTVSRMNKEIFKILRKRFNELSDIKLTVEQFGLLHEISVNNDDVGQQDMATVLGKDKSSIMRLIDLLEEKKLVTRTADVHDRRKNCLVVTDLGYETIQNCLDIEFNLLEELQKGIPESDLEAFFRVVQTLKQNAEKL